MKARTKIQLISIFLIFYCFLSCRKNVEHKVIEKKYVGVLTRYERGYIPDMSGLYETTDTLDFWITAKLINDSIHFTTSNEDTLHLNSILATQPHPFSHKYYMPSTRPAVSFDFTSNDSFKYRWNMAAPVGPSAMTIEFRGKKQ